MVKKWIVVLLAILLLAACEAPPLEPVPEVEPPSELPEEDAGEESPPLSEALFLVDLGADSAYLEAARHFARKVSQLTGDQLEIQVRSYFDASSHLVQGRAQLAFLDSGERRGLGGYLDATALPFLYSGYESFTMSLNSDDLLLAVGEELRASGIVPLAAFYTPGRHLITDWQTSNYQEFSQAVVATEADSPSVQGLRFLGVTLLEEDDPAARAQLLLEGQLQGIEMTLAEMMEIEWRGSDLYLTLSYQTIRPVFLSTQSNFYDSLPPAHRAAVQEAVASMYEELDYAFLAAEAEAVQALHRQGLLIYEDFSGARSEIFSNLLTGEGEEQLLTKEEQALRALVAALD